MKLAAIIAFAWLSACALVPNVAGPSAADALADKTIADAATAEERKLRATAVLAIVAELSADRVVAEDLGAAPEALARIKGFEAMAKRLREQRGLWLETDLYEVRVAIYYAVGGAVALQVRLYLARAGVSLASARTALRYSGKGAAMLTDLDRLFDAIKTGEVAAAELWDGLAARIERNRLRIEQAARVS